MADRSRVGGSSATPDNATTPTVGTSRADSAPSPFANASTADTRADAGTYPWNRTGAASKHTRSSATPGQHTDTPGTGEYAGPAAAHERATSRGHAGATSSDERPAIAESLAGAASQQTAAPDDEPP